MLTSPTYCPKCGAANRGANCEDCNTLDLDPKPAAEAYDAAQKIEGERATLLLRSPLGQFDAAALTSSPLFGGTEADPQKSLFGK